MQLASSLCCLTVFLTISHQGLSMWEPTDIQISYDTIQGHNAAGSNTLAVHGHTHNPLCVTRGCFGNPKTKKRTTRTGGRPTHSGNTGGAGCGGGCGRGGSCGC
ncbi:hypothetical protein PGTUg99_026963 [Puccinia graminis f. sp. tritici]|uniref:Secreted protein n=1 Tax=Puccinia graminis f. sp. tritici TaxID=56615 RepID=A0A5B0RLJ9_PUCGR|nr:hypothetical protein PGTUg99_026963 [Puccinia graminis f. sp. tritici]